MSAEVGALYVTADGTAYRYANGSGGLFEYDVLDTFGGHTTEPDLPADARLVWTPTRGIVTDAVLREADAVIDTARYDGADPVLARAWVHRCTHVRYGILTALTPTTEETP